MLPDFEGELLLDDESLHLASLDFGKVRSRRPAAVLRPASVNDVAAAVRFCARAGVPLAPRGCAHSAGGQMMAPDGLVIDMKSMNRVLAITESHADVEAGAQWGEVLPATLQHGLTPLVVTDWLGVSVGGTLSMGGFGFMSFHRGSQMDHVLELEVVTGDGEVRTCSRQVNAELFDAVLGTHGVFGIITRARIELEPAPRSVRVVQACYGSVRAMWEDFSSFTREGRADLVHAFAAGKSVDSITTRMNSTDRMRVDPAHVELAMRSVEGEWVFNLELVDLVRDGSDRNPIDVTRLGCEPGLVDTWEMSWRDFCFRLPPLIIEEQLRGAAPHPELCVWVPMTPEGLDLIEGEYARVHPTRDLGDGPNLFFPVRPDLISPSLFRLPDASDHVAFWGLLRRADPATPARIAEQVADNEAIYGRAVQVGAVRYLPDTTPEAPAFWHSHFGDQWERVRELKGRYDPDGVLMSSFGRHARASEPGA